MYSWDAFCGYYYVMQEAELCCWTNILKLKGKIEGTVEDIKIGRQKQGCCLKSTWLFGNNQKWRENCRCGKFVKSLAFSYRLQDLFLKNLIFINFSSQKQPVLCQSVIVLLSQPSRQLSPYQRFQEQEVWILPISHLSSIYTLKDVNYKPTWDLGLILPLHTFQCLGILIKYI